MWADPFILVFYTWACLFRLITSWQKRGKAGDVAHFPYVGLVGHVVSHKDSQQTQTILDHDAALCEPAVLVDHVEDFGKGILEDEELLELGRGAGQVGEDDEGFVADGIAGVVERGYQALDAAGGCEDAFLCSLGPGQGDGADELQGVEAGVEVGRVEEVEEKRDVVLALP